MTFTPSTFIIALLALFLLGSMLGYLLEVLYRRYFSAKKWVNPGFLYGPWLPLYGFGMVVMFLLCSLFAKALPESMPLYNPFGNLYGRANSGATVYDLIVIGCMGVSLIALEFLAGLLFVKGFKVRLWDYTNMKGNILDIICPAFNVIWFSIAVLYYYGLSPFVYTLMVKGAEYLFGSGDGSKVAHFGMIFALGIAYGIFLIDFVKSVGLFARIRKIAEEKGVLSRYEALREEADRIKALGKAKLYDALPEKVKEGIARAKEPSKFAMKVRKLLLINPDLTSTAGNYDESGRPAKEE